MIAKYASYSERTISNTIKRYVWKMLFSRRLEPFFLNPSDHIGSERIVVGDVYEYANLHVLEKLINKLKLGNGIAIDIGANIGNHSVWLSRKFKKILCFEPGLIASHVLEANLLTSGSSNYEIYKYALSDANGKGKLNIVSSSNLGSSQVDIDDYGDITVRVGDEVLADLHGVELIKIDVEGAEIKVLNGLRSTLTNNLPVLCVEVLTRDSWQLVKPYLDGLGYTGYYVVASSINSYYLDKIISLICGRTYILKELEDNFKDGGYDMIICLNKPHRDSI